jgi:hypothetical protein
MDIGNHIEASVTKGKRTRTYRGTIVDRRPATLMDIETGETREAVKVRIHDEFTERLVWLPAGSQSKRPEDTTP